MTLEAGTKVASSTVEALKSQPLALALIVINILFLATGLWIIHEVGVSSQEQRVTQNRLVEHLMENCVITPHPALKP